MQQRSETPGAMTPPLAGDTCEDAARCTAQVLVGETWIAAQSAPRENHAEVGTRVPLERGTRFSVRACCDIVTALITTPRLSPDFGFILQQRDGVRVLTVTSGSGRPPASLPDTPAPNRRTRPAPFRGRTSADALKASP